MIKIIKSNIKDELKDRNIKVQKLCKDLGVHRNYINNLTDKIKLETIIDIANSIGCKLEDLLVGVE